MKGYEYAQSHTEQQFPISRLHLSACLDSPRKQLSTIICLLRLQNLWLVNQKTKKKDHQKKKTRRHDRP